MSALCQKRTFCTAAELFDHLVGAGEQGRWHSIGRRAVEEPNHRQRRLLRTRRERPRSDRPDNYFYEFPPSHELCPKPETDTLPYRIGVVVHHSKSVCPMSALGQKRTFSEVRAMSALPPKADICSATTDVRFGPIADTVPSKSCLKYEGSHYYPVR